jgi:hypothetical protein
MTAENDFILRTLDTAASDPQHPAATSPLDEPMDATVYEVHPAFLPRQCLPAEYGADYPYGPPSAYLPLPSSELPEFLLWARSAGQWIVRTSETYFAALQSPPDFVVPKTFGMSAILGIMTALALVFACLRWLSAEPVFYFFFSVEGLTICLAQMLNGKAPRLASIAAGAISLPAFIVLAAVFTQRWVDPGIICLAIVIVPFGAVLGYLTGTCAAGIFLVMDYLEPYLQGHAFSASSRLRSTTR